MKAALIDGKGRLWVDTVPDPEPGPYDALCEILYGATCTGTDSHLIDGSFPFPPPAYPAILGHESIGRVVETGSKVRYLSVGDLVTRVGAPPHPGGAYQVAWGGFAERGVACDHQAMQEDGLPEAEWAGARVQQVLPDGFDPAASTMIVTWRETLSFWTRLEVPDGASVLIVGTGGNALAYVAHAAHKSDRTVAVLGSPRREADARAVGATHFVPYTAEDAVDALREIAPGGFDFILDVVGKRDSLDAVLPALRPGGTISIYGMDDFGDATLHPGRAPGPFAYTFPGYNEAESHEEVVRRMQAGALDAGHWLSLDDAFPLDRIGDAYEALASRERIKAVIQIRG